MEVKITRPAFIVGDMVYPHHDFGTYDGAREVRAVRAPTNKEVEEAGYPPAHQRFLYRLAGSEEWRWEKELALACPVERRVE